MRPFGYYTLTIFQKSSLSPHIQVLYGCNDSIISEQLSYVDGKGWAPVHFDHRLVKEYANQAAHQQDGLV